MCRTVQASQLIEEFSLLDDTYDVVFLVPSMIQQTLGSLFDSHKRYEQTIEGLRSIRGAVPHAFIIFFEAGNPQDEWMENIQALVDVYVQQDVENLHRVITSNKSLGEAIMTRLVAKNLDPGKFKRFFKLSARYSLSEDFDLSSFETGENAHAAFHRFSNGRQTWLGTMLYYVPPVLWDVYISGLEMAPDRIGHGMNIETTMFFTFRDGQYVHRDNIGGIGECAYDGNIHVH